jgi:hypothetical protein
LRIFKNKIFNRFAQHEKISDSTLIDAIQRAKNGLIDADLGGGVIKQRIAREGQGKSSGYRTIILFRTDKHVFFVYGFAKNERDNITKTELLAFKELASDLFKYTDKVIDQTVKNGTLIEVISYEKNENVQK